MARYGNNGKMRKLEVVSLDDPRLVLIDPTSDGFFEDVLGFKTDRELFARFVEQAEEVMYAGLGPFYVPIYDPSFDGEQVVFQSGNDPATDKSFSFWQQKIEEMPKVDGKKWCIGTKYQRYAFLVWLINRLIASRPGWNIESAMKAICFDSSELGHCGNFFYSDELGDDGFFYDNDAVTVEKTGGREVCGVYDLANTFKMLSCSNSDSSGHWCSGGCPNGDMLEYVLADFRYSKNKHCSCAFSVPWIVLA